MGKGRLLVLDYSDTSAVMRVYCSSKGPKCDSQHPHQVDHNHLSLQGNLMPLASMGTPTHMAYTHHTDMIRNRSLMYMRLIWEFYLGLLFEFCVSVWLHTFVMVMLVSFAVDPALLFSCCAKTPEPKQLIKYLICGSWFQG